MKQATQTISDPAKRLHSVSYLFPHRSGEVDGSEETAS